MEVNYPEIGGLSSTHLIGESLPDYLIYIVQFLVAFAVIVSVFSIISGGVLWVTSGGNPLKIKEGKEKFSSAILGLIIILSSYTFLFSLNPDLTEVDDPVIEERKESHPPGIYLSAENAIPLDFEEISDDVRRIERSKRNLEELGGSIRTIRIANPLNNRGEVTDYYYGVLIQEDRGFRGRCEFLVNPSPEVKDFTINDNKNISSVTVIQINANPPERGFVTAHSRPDFREDYPYETLNLNALSMQRLSINGVWSLDIEGSYGVVLSSGEDWETSDDGCGVFLESNPISDLKGHHMNLCNPRKITPIYAAYDSCSTHYVALPLFR